jgi:carbamoyl-phosphate synthase large subunit
LFSENKNKLEELGVKVWISPLNTIKLCNNKFKFWETLHDKFLMPNPINSAFLKPDIGAGARGTEVIKAKEGSHLWEYLPGKEYTVDVFCDDKSNSLGTVVRTRNGIKAGISVKGTVLRHEQIEKNSEKLCKELKIQGPCCIQWKENGYGLPKLIECNPRLGGGTYFSTSPGINPAEIYLENKSKKQYPKEIKVTRYFEEIVIS